MTTHRSRWFGVVLLAACAMPVIHCCAATYATDRYAEISGTGTAWTATLGLSLQGGRLANSSAKRATYFEDIPMTVAGVYGATMLDMLSSGPLMLVQWPNDCCASNRRWHTGQHAAYAPASSKADPVHVFFLWHES